MREFNELSALVRAPAFSRALYVDVATRWRGIAARYLVLMLLLSWLAVFIQRTLAVTRFLENDAPAALKDFPPIKIEKGVASSSVPQPYIMKDSHGKPIFVLDTTGTVKKPSDVGAEILVTGSEIIQEDSPGVVRGQSLSTFPDMTVDRPTVLGWLRTFRNIMIPLGLPAFLLASFAFRLLWALILAGIGMGFNAAFGGNLKLGALFRLAVVSSTASLIATTILSLLMLNFGWIEWIIFPAITLVYLAYAVKVSVDATRPVSSFPIEFGSDQPPPGEPDQGGPETMFP